MLDALEGTPLEFLTTLDPIVLIGIGGILLLALVSLLVIGRMQRKHNHIYCPYCLTVVPKADNCESCKEPLHKLYQKHSDGNHPPELISIVGFSGHGKTVYLASLLYALTYEIQQAWPGFFRRSLDQHAIDHLRRNMDILRGGDLPDSTRLNFPKPSIQQLQHMPGYRSRVVALYDPPGEAFDVDQRIEKYARFVAQARATFFLISLEDLEPPYGGEMHRLLEVYTLGMANLDAKSHQQHLIVVFTKADALLNEFLSGKPTLVNYLDDDSPMLLQDMSTYFAQMQSTSEALSQFVRTELQAENFDNLAQDEFKSVTYCIVSALGSPPEISEEQEAKLSVAIQPRRVLDPLLWLLEKT